MIVKNITIKYHGTASISGRTIIGETEADCWKQIERILSLPDVRGFSTQSTRVVRNWR